MNKRSRLIFFVSFLLLTSFANHNLFGLFKLIKQKNIGIVTASILNCRKFPNIKSKIIKTYHFGTPLLLNNRTKIKTKIGNMNNYWYQDVKTKGWVYAGFLILTKYDKNRIGSIKTEMIYANAIGGGMSFFYKFQPILINNYFIVALPLYVFK